MPLRDYEIFFAPEQMDTMKAAFAAAWQNLAASLGPKTSQEEIQRLRAKLAECVVMSALDGSFQEPEDVAREALECLHETHGGEPLV
jgi:hypothetical protein